MDMYVYMMWNDDESLRYDNYAYKIFMNNLIFQVFFSNLTTTFDLLNVPLKDKTLLS